MITVIDEDVYGAVIKSLKWLRTYIVKGQENSGEAVQAIYQNLVRYWTPEMRDSLAKCIIPDELSESRQRIDELNGQLKNAHLANRDLLLLIEEHGDKTIRAHATRILNDRLPTPSEYMKG